MPVRLNTLLDVEAKKLDKEGVFNGFIDIDSNFHFDPSLLSIVDIPEFKNSKKKFDEHFLGVMKLLKRSKQNTDKFYKTAVKKLQFKEVPFISLGFSKEGNSGSGIGPKLASKIAETGKIIVDAGFEDPAIFELLGLFEENIGADRISDMTIRILYENLVQFTERVTKELGIKAEEYKFGIETKLLPPNKYNKNKPIIFLPKDLLRKIPIANSWYDISSVEGYNESLRDRTNSLVGGNLRTFITTRRKSDVKWEILNNPEILKYLLEVHKMKPRKSYDFTNDPKGEFLWLDLMDKALNENPINLVSYNPITPKNILEVIKAICIHLRQLIENNGWWEFLYDGTGKLRNERFAQKLFYGIADSYCRVNNLDLNREPNAGSGPVDFKISSGYQSKITLEIKYSSSSKLLHGYEIQLPTYNKAEKSDHSVYLVVKVGNRNSTLEKLKQLVRETKESNKRTPLLFIINGDKRLSASKKNSLDEEE